jgi:hypothetical protein
MSLDLITGQFARIGARVKLRSAPLQPLRIDIRSDLHGEYFDIALNAAHPMRLRVIDIKPRGPHLLLLAEGDAQFPDRGGRGKQKFLCGHDERHWFVAAIPESTPAADVRGALDAPPSRRRRSRKKNPGVFSWPRAITRPRRARRRCRTRPSG